MRNVIVFGCHLVAADLIVADLVDKEPVPRLLRESGARTLFKWHVDPEHFS